MQSTDKLSDLGNSTLEQLIAELGQQFVKIDGSNATGVGTEAILGKLTGSDQVAKASDLNTKVNVVGDNATDAGVNTMLGKLTNKVVKTVDLKTKVAEKAVVDAIIASHDFTDKVYTKSDADTAFVKTDGSNISTQADKGKALVDVLVPALATVGTDDTKKVYTKSAAETAFIKTDGSNISTQADKGKALVDVLVPALATVGTDDTKKVYTKTEAGNTFLKTADLGTKVAEKAVVDVLVPALATVGTDDTKKVYTKTEAGSTFLKTADLATKVAEKAVVDVLVPALATGADDKGIYTKKGVDDALVSKADTAALANKLNVDGNNISDAFVTALTTGGTNDNRVYTKTAANTALTDKVNVSGNNATEAGVNAMLSKLTDKVVQTSQLETLAVAGKVLGVKDGNKSILVDKLGGFLDNSTDNQYGAQSNQTAKEFLTGKGMKPTAAEIAADPALQQHVAKISLQSPEFKKAVQEEMSQQYFEIPSDPNAPISADW